MTGRVTKIWVKIKGKYHEVWRRYHNLRYSKHRERASVHLAKRRNTTHPLNVRRGA